MTLKANARTYVQNVCYVSVGIAWMFLTRLASEVTSLYEQVIQLWDVRQLAVRATFPVGAKVNLITFSPDGTRLLAAGEDGTVWVWGVPGGAP